jgi:hypothetical protein
MHSYVSWKQYKNGTVGDLGVSGWLFSAASHGPKKLKVETKGENVTYYYANSSVSDGNLERFDGVMLRWLDLVG